VDQCTDHPPQLPEDETWPATKADRLFVATDLPFDPKSLVGSWFLSDHQRGWQGCVVAEPAPGVYLVETLDWIIGAGYEQRLVPLAEMADWSFFDTADWMGTAYANGVRQRWDRERAEAGENAA